MCALLISHGENIERVMYDWFTKKNCTALDLYGSEPTLNISNEQKEKSRQTMKLLWENGPHPNAKWRRRWAFMNVLTGCGYLKKCKGVKIDTSIAIPPEILDTNEKIRLNKARVVFSNKDLMRLVFSFL
jgi:hypothetical protein